MREVGEDMGLERCAVRRGRTGPELVRFNELVVEWERGEKGVKAWGEAFFFSFYKCLERTKEAHCFLGRRLAGFKRSC